MLLTALFPWLMSSSLFAHEPIAKHPSDLVFGAREDAAPMSFRDENNAWKGYSIEICRRIYTDYLERYQNDNPTDIRASDKNVEFTHIPALERMEAFIEGRIDILCGATTVTVKRMEHVDFSLLIFSSGTGIIKKIKTDSSVLANPGSQTEEDFTVTYVGCSDGMHYADCTTTDDWVKRHFASAVKPVPKASHNAAFEALKDDEAKFYVGDRVILERRLKSMGEESKQYQIAPAFLSYEPYAIAISKDNDLLLQSANAVLARLYRNAGKEGGIDQLYSIYFTRRQSNQLEAMYRILAIPN
jgi:polar amino acid transport system substrate-binding protein/glutamate/aspartate transport system substrate-binding protein